MRSINYIDKIACICITDNRVELLPRAIQCFRDQDYEEKELLIFYDASDAHTASFARNKTDVNLVKLDGSSFKNSICLKSNESNITFIEIDHYSKFSLGEKRNLATEYAEADFICVWDDDDWYSPRRLSQQILACQHAGKPACALSSLTIYDSIHHKAYYSIKRHEGWEGSLLCRKEYMEKYLPQNTKEDTPVLKRLFADGYLVLIDFPHLYTYIIHGKNISGTQHLNSVVAASTSISDEECEGIKYVLEESIVFR
ncbi:MAG TPA: glycosyltransferase family A protein [Cytophagaceae bacterium]|nr:glycosyltransferase family A protein [Cytophagaceae bacterium]